MGKRAKEGSSEKVTYLLCIRGGKEMNQRKRQEKSVISIGSSTGRDSGNCKDEW